jgi:predicted nucleic acid-binding protein
LSASYRKPYVESSVFIAFIRGETTQGPNHDQDAKAIVNSILVAAEAGAFPIVTSSLTIAEVFKRKGAALLTNQQNDDLRPYFREQYIQIVEVDRDVAERANELCRTFQADAAAQLRGLRPNDAIHIASAERAECDVILAWDPDFMSQKPRITWLQLENPKTILVAVPAQQMPLTNGEGQGLTLMVKRAVAATEPAEADTVPALEPKPELLEKTSGGTPPSVIPVKSPKEADKGKGPDGVQSQPTPSS